jgi:predicted nucleic acid-binding protein
VNAEQYVLDTSALLAFMSGERGADVVERILNDKSSRVFIPWPVLAEIYYITRRRRGEKDADKRYVLIKELPATVVWHLDEPEILTAARLKADFPLSFADSLIAAAAVSRTAVLVHHDSEFDALRGIVRQRFLGGASSAESGRK